MDYRQAISIVIYPDTIFDYIEGRSFIFITTMKYKQLKFFKKELDMNYKSYKILAAQRLAVDPNALLNYLEYMGRVYVTTPDGQQHSWTYAELDRPAIPVAEKAQKGPGSPLELVKKPAEATIRVAKKKARK